MNADKNKNLFLFAFICVHPRLIFSLFQENETESHIRTRRERQFQPGRE